MLKNTVACLPSSILVRARGKSKVGNPRRNGQKKWPDITTARKLLREWRTLLSRVYRSTTKPVLALQSPCKPEHEMDPIRNREGRKQQRELFLKVPVTGVEYWRFKIIGRYSNRYQRPRYLTVRVGCQEGYGIDDKRLRFHARARLRAAVRAAMTLH